MLRKLLGLIDFLRNGPVIEVQEDSKFFVAYESGAMDVYAKADTTIFSGSSALIQTGVSFALPILPFCLGVIAQIWPRSGLSVMNKVETGAGLVDTDYRGKVGVHLYNFGDQPVFIKEGDRVAQICFPICVMPKMSVKRVKYLKESERGSKGFGSTGIK